MCSYGNCFTFALARWWRYGGYVVLHKSPRGWWPHVVYSRDLVTFEQFLPVSHQRWYAWILRWHVPPPIFYGRSYPWEPEQ